MPSVGAAGGGLVQPLINPIGAAGNPRVFIGASAEAWLGFTIEVNGSCRTSVSYSRRLRVLTAGTSPIPAPAALHCIDTRITLGQVSPPALGSLEMRLLGIRSYPLIDKPSGAVSVCSLALVLSEWVFL